MMENGLFLENHTGLDSLGDEGLMKGLIKQGVVGSLVDGKSVT